MKSKEKNLEYVRAYRKKNKLKYNLYMKNYMKRKRNAKSEDRFSGQAVQPVGEDER